MAGRPALACHLVRASGILVSVLVHNLKQGAHYLHSGLSSGLPSEGRECKDISPHARSPDKVR